MPMSATILGRPGIPVTRVLDYYWTDYAQVPNEKVCSVVLLGGPVVTRVIDLPLTDVMVTLGHTHWIGDEYVPCERLNHCPSYCNHSEFQCKREIKFIEEVV